VSAGSHSVVTLVPRTRFATNAARVANRVELLGMLQDIFRSESRDKWEPVCRGEGGWGWYQDRQSRQPHTPLS